MNIVIREIKIDGKYKYIVLDKDNAGTDKDQLVYETETSDFENKGELLLDALDFCKYARMSKGVWQ